MSADGVSLISFLDAPFMVGDPDGRIVYVNPAFERRFGTGDDELLGREMATLFAGGGREVLLAAVAEVCANGATARFRMREDGTGYVGVCSPIEAAAKAPGDRVGVVVLLCDEPEVDARLLAVQQEIQEPLDEALGCLDQLIEQTGGRRNEASRGAVERGLGAVARARKWSDELAAALRGRPGNVSADATLDPVRVLRQAAVRVGPQFADAGIGLNLLVPAQLPSARGDEDMLEMALVRLLRLRMAKAEPNSSLMLAARPMGRDALRAILISVVDQPRRTSGSGKEDADEREPRSLRDAVELLGGRVHTINIPEAGRATAVRLPIAVG
jgi:PAS domain S-box-containing protein